MVRLNRTTLRIMSLSIGLSSFLLQEKFLMNCAAKTLVVHQLQKFLKIRSSRWLKFSASGSIQSITPVNNEFGQNVRNHLILLFLYQAHEPRATDACKLFFSSLRQTLALQAQSLDHSHHYNSPARNTISYQHGI